MKKIILSIFALLVVFTITGCNSNKETKESDEVKSNNEVKNNEVKNSDNAVVVYFSATGTTKKIAERIAQFSNSDIIRIIPTEEYKSEDLDYNSDCRANREQKIIKQGQKLRIKLI